MIELRVAINCLIWYNEPFDEQVFFYMGYYKVEIRCGVLESYLSLDASRIVTNGLQKHYLGNLWASYVKCFAKWGESCVAQVTL
jgi:hypothetical protein